MRGIYYVRNWDCYCQNWNHLVLMLKYSGRIMKIQWPCTDRSLCWIYWIMGAFIPWASYVKMRVVHALGVSGTFSPHRLKRKLLVSNPDMHHSTCVTHMPWCMSGSLTRRGGENDTGIPGTCATRNFTYLARSPWRKILASSATSVSNNGWKYKIQF